jgi:hypothetical protein
MYSFLCIFRKLREQLLKNFWSNTWTFRRHAFVTPKTKKKSVIASDLGLQMEKHGCFRVIPPDGLAVFIPTSQKQLAPNVLIMWWISSRVNWNFSFFSIFILFNFRKAKTKKKILYHDFSSWSLWALYFRVFAYKAWRKLDFLPTFLRRKNS